MRLFEIEDTNLLEKYKDEVNFALDKYNQGIVIYRGKNTCFQRINYIDPTSRITNRKSINTYNYYTLWIDNDPDWSEFPKRSRSAICSTNKFTAEFFGNPMIVIPLIDCKIGVCPNHDLWYSFGQILTLKDFNLWLFTRFNKNWPDDDNKDLTYSELIRKLKEVKYEPYNVSLFNTLLAKYHDAENMMHEVLNPIDNGFTTTTWNQFNIKGDREVWLSAPYLLIVPSVFIELAKERKNAIS